MFTNREEAGDRLAASLDTYRHDAEGIILALPRGGVALGYRISLALHLPLDVLITRKLRAPGNPEYAMGALAETGATFLNQEAIRVLSISDEELEKEIQFQQQEIVRRQELYRRGRSLPVLTGKTVLLVDDGIATGSTFFASIQALKDLRPARVVGAIPVGPWETIRLARQQVDELVVIETPEPFFAVGNHYVDFRQVEDEDVIRYLALAAEALGDGKEAAHT